MSEKDDGKVRLDKWLWAARFFLSLIHISEPRD